MPLMGEGSPVVRLLLLLAVMLCGLLAGCASAGRSEATVPTEPAPAAEVVDPPPASKARPKWVRYEWQDEYPIVGTLANVCLGTVIGVGYLGLLGLYALASGGGGGPKLF
jgi:hypothetical protein